ncbi:MAG: DNA ligase D [Deltaproteobacteria bacterium]|nr:DNA ligase D [Deltaproteobacteria bacterium]
MPKAMQPSGRSPAPPSAGSPEDASALGTAPLAEYRDKRRFDRTNEPEDPDPLGRAGPTHGGEFVVHLHHASHVHYDLRLECGGVLLSFAVPRGPCLDPADKRLAMQTEAHPLGYLDFEDVIPEGNYGAGSMIVWDRGRVRYVEAPAEEGLRNGKLDLELRGTKLKGRFALVETTGRPGAPKSSGRSWLFFKKPDVFARTGYDVTVEEPRSVLSGLTVDELVKKDEIAAEIEREAERLGAPVGLVETRRLVPMLCTQGNRLEGKGWLFELKLDGVRILADKQAGAAALFYRSSRDATEAFPEIARAVRALAPSRVVLDGEIVAFDENGKPSFQRLARRLHRSTASMGRFTSRDPPVVLLVFDVLAVGARDLRPLPLSDRKLLLRKIVGGRGLVRALDHLEDDGAPLYALCQREKLEGVVAKKRSAPYRPGPKRTGEWVKIKCERDEDFVVIGWTVGENARERLGALDLGGYEGDTLVVRGKVGSGLDEGAIDDLLERLRPLTIDRCAARGELDRAPRGRTFVRPEVVVSVRFLGWSDEGRLRFPVFRGVREDISPRDCTVGPPGSATPDSGAESPELVTPAEIEATPGAVATTRAAVARVKLTNRNKVFWPADGLTKGDLLDYYRDIAPALLPYLHERPVVLVRYPDGIDGKHFYQWNVPRGTPSWVRTIELHHHDGRNVTGFLVDDLDTLLHIANLGCIPIHVMSTRADRLDRCDWLTIDFDLGKSPLLAAITLARTLRGLLESLGLAGFPKTSGQRGLHVLVPTGGAPSDAAKMLAEVLGRMLVDRHRDIATMERTVEARGGRVYVDTGQTGRGRTIVAPYSVRAYPGGRVSTPLLWEEISGALDPGAFTLKTVPGRVASLGDPMAPMLETEPDLGAVLPKLQELLAGGRP